MRWNAKLWRWVGLGACAALVLSMAGIYLLVPALIRSRLESFYAGHVTFDRWWIGPSSAGVSHLVLHEGDQASGSPWLEVARVETDLSLGALLRGQFLPRSVTLERPEARLRLNKSGQVLTRASLRPEANDAKAALPRLTLVDMTIHLNQEGRAPFTVGGIDGSLGEGRDGIVLQATSTQPSWAPCRTVGTFSRDFKSGTVTITSLRDIDATEARVRTLPWVPPQTWDSVVPTGPVGLNIQLTLDHRRSPSFAYEAVVELHSIAATLPSLNLTTRAVTGRVRCAGPIVSLESVRSETLGGSAITDGLLDFSAKPALFRIQLGLKAIDIQSAPAAWQLGEIGATGKLSGKVDVVARIDAREIDLTGSSGEAEVEHATLQGFPVKLLRLSMKAKGNDLQFESKQPAEAPGLGLRLQSLVPVWITGFQAPAQGPKIELPRSITTQVEFEEIDIGQVLTRLTLLTRIKIPIRIGGKASLRAKATIPLGSLRSLRQYEFHGQAKLLGAVIEGVDLGRLDATLDLQNGLLTLTDFRGQLLDRPAGTEAAPPEPTAGLPINGPLPAGGFRGKLTAQLDPPGKIVAEIEAEQVPLGELTAPWLPRPNPVAGGLSAKLNASARLLDWERAESWTVDGSLTSAAIRYRAAELDRLTTSVTLKGGRLTLGDLEARLEGNPLKINAWVDLKEKRPFHLQLNVKDWHLAKFLPFWPRLPSPAPMDGSLNAETEVNGTLAPFSILSVGRAKLGDLRVGRVDVGEVPITWRTEGDEVVLSSLEAKTLGGKVTGEGRFPAGLARPGRLAFSFDGIKAALVEKQVLGATTSDLSGTAKGRLTLLIPADLDQVEADLAVGVDDFAVRNVPLSPLVATAQVKAGQLAYQVKAGAGPRRTQLDGSLPIKPLMAGQLASTDGSLLALGYSLAEAQKLAGMNVLPNGLVGVVGIDANLRFMLEQPMAVGVRGVFEARELSWTRDFPLGQIRGVVTRSPRAWRVDQLSGEFLGGPLSGSVWNEPAAENPGPDLVRFDLKVDRAPLARVVGFVPDLASRVTGVGSFNLSGRYATGANATGELFVPKATILDLPIVDLRIPIELSLEADGATGTLRARRLSGRISGGQVRGDASMRVGQDRSFQVAINLANIDLETITRTLTTAARPGTGKISGKIQLHGPDPSAPARYRGRVDLDLDDASLVEIPILRELERFLGAARGGLVEDGDLRATIANKHLVIEAMTLQGKLFQIHAAGTVAIDGALSLEVLVNTNQIIPETGQALLARIPGLADVLGRNEQATVRFASFLSNRLLKFRVGGTVRNPSIQADPAVAVTSSAIGFFSAALNLPLDLIR